MIIGCRSVESYRKLNRIEEGTYGIVYRAQETSTGEIYALKRLKLEREKEGFPITSLREIYALSKLSPHQNIVRLKEIVVGKSIDHVFIVMEFIDHDLKSLLTRHKASVDLPLSINNPQFQISEIKTILRQLLDATRLMHDHWIVHRDLKTSNLLFTNTGLIGTPPPALTPVVVTLWYRAPEILLGAPTYSSPADIWSIGCIFGELLSGRPLFPGTSDIDQINHIFKILGSPTNDIWPSWETLPGARLFSSSVSAASNSNSRTHKYNHLRGLFSSSGLSDNAFDLMNRLLLYDPSKRITAFEALSHPWFEECPLPKDPCLFPTWPSLNIKSKKPHSSIASETVGAEHQESQKNKKRCSSFSAYDFLL
ncbi:hypothetical protein DI09_19p210 [Mitosporidium daphniae]|uniref:cyclin-dependent kinase n=1 Tax=Mitosporidium daphniae TaxID=1485682 RepID=A0A098VTS8_9MICR|nr:uncharacterized protein DI09_19p210 [Mitosporidium daphniae]KGG52239.1 hypothetical protein DI09_19p210 [Mitosporidium daphniae]|eukprot:XP_013238666.1 uncharacterized protein DI09_19p210 [Mitosporidium daphniae]